MIIDKRTDAEVFDAMLVKRTKELDENQMAVEIRAYLCVKNGRAPTRVDTDAPLTLTGQWAGY